MANFEGLPAGLFEFLHDLAVDNSPHKLWIGVTSAITAVGGIGY